MTIHLLTADLSSGVIAASAAAFSAAAFFFSASAAIRASLAKCANYSYDEQTYLKILYLQNKQLTGSCLLKSSFSVS